MGMIHCSFCARETLDVESVCQFCGKRFKRAIWQRKLRRNEAYGALLTVAGVALLGYVKPIAILLILSGIVLGASWFVRQRVR